MPSAAGSPAHKDSRERVHGVSGAAVESAQRLVQHDDQEEDFHVSEVSNGVQPRQTDRGKCRNRRSRRGLARRSAAGWPTVAVNW